MADFTQKLLYELLRKMPADVGVLKHGQMEIRTELHAMRGTVVSIHQDVNNIDGILGRHEQRPERPENRLERRELSEAQARFEPHP